MIINLGPPNKNSWFRPTQNTLSFCMCKVEPIVLFFFNHTFILSMLDIGTFASMLRNKK